VKGQHHQRRQSHRGQQRFWNDATDEGARGIGERGERYKQESVSLQERGGGLAPIGQDQTHQKKYIDRQFIKRMLRHINKKHQTRTLNRQPKEAEKEQVIIGSVWQNVRRHSEPDCLRCAERLYQSGFDAGDETFLLLIVGWCTQLYDERSRITQTAAELFPSLLTQLLGAMNTPAIVFEEENGCLSCIFEALFALLKNKRAKTLSDIAHDVLIETINIFTTVAGDLDETAFMKIITFLHEHTIFEKEKHEKVRAGSIAYALFVIYGTEAQELQNSNTTVTHIRWQCWRRRHCPSPFPSTQCRAMARTRPRKRRTTKRRKMTPEM